MKRKPRDLLGDSDKLACINYKLFSYQQEAEAWKGQDARDEDL